MASDKPHGGVDLPHAGVPARRAPRDAHSADSVDVLRRVRALRPRQGSTPGLLPKPAPRFGVTRGRNRGRQSAARCAYRLALVGYEGRDVDECCNLGLYAASASETTSPWERAPGPPKLSPRRNRLDTTSRQATRSFTGEVVATRFLQSRGLGAVLVLPSSPGVSRERNDQSPPTALGPTTTPRAR